MIRQRWLRFRLWWLRHGINGIDDIDDHLRQQEEAIRAWPATKRQWLELRARLWSEHDRLSGRGSRVIYSLTRRA